MSKISNYYYRLSFNDDEIIKYNKNELEEFINNGDYDTLLSVEKVYRLDNKKSKYALTLYNSEYEFQANELIVHYENLDEKIYGKYFLSNFDREVIETFN